MLHPRLPSPSSGGGSPPPRPRRGSPPVVVTITTSARSTSTSSDSFARLTLACFIALPAPSLAAPLAAPLLVATALDHDQLTVGPHLHLVLTLAFAL
eukprot:4789954-Pyramimonas_sp.AAC.1